MIKSTCDLLFRDFDKSYVVSINWVSDRVFTAEAMLCVR